jgi:hypothetical protein
MTQRSNPLAEFVHGLLTAAARGANEAGVQYVRDVGKKVDQQLTRLQDGVRVATTRCGRCDCLRLDHARGPCNCGRCPSFIEVVVTPPASPPRSRT